MVIIQKFIMEKFEEDTGGWFCYAATGFDRNFDITTVLSHLKKRQPLRISPEWLSLLVGATRFELATTRPPV